jgi:hypothetical protein
VIDVNIEDGVGIEFKTIEDGKVVTYKLGAIGKDGKFKVVFFRENSNTYVREGIYSGGTTRFGVKLNWLEELSEKDIVVTRDPEEVLELLKKE